MISIEQKRGSKRSIRLKQTYQTCRLGQQQSPEATEITAKNRDYLIRTNLPADRAFIPNTHRKSANRGSKASSTGSQDTSTTTYYDKNSNSSVKERPWRGKNPEKYGPSLSVSQRQDCCKQKQYTNTSKHGQKRERVKVWMNTTQIHCFKTLHQYLFEGK